jgi:hypothetical protein
MKTMTSSALSFKDVITRYWTQGRIQDFKLGRGGALKKIAQSGGRCEKFWGISCEKSWFYAKKIIFFPILGGARAGCAPPGSAPGTVSLLPTKVIMFVHIRTGVQLIFEQQLNSNIQIGKLIYLWFTLWILSTSENHSWIQSYIVLGLLSTKCSRKYKNGIGQNNLNYIQLVNIINLHHYSDILL